MNWEGSEGTGGDVDCTTAIDQLYHYLDGELTEQRRLKIAEHLEYCGPCAGAAEFEAELRQVIADRCRDRVPDALRERIAALIEDERRHHGMASGVEGVP
jgi:mycothiol system anti-sigma-R factor